MQKLGRLDGVDSVGRTARETRSDRGPVGGDGCRVVGSARLAKLGEIAAETYVFAAVLLRADASRLCQPRGDRGGGNAGAAGQLAVDGGGLRRDMRSDGRRGERERAAAAGGSVAAIPFASFAHHPASVAWLVLAAIIGAMLGGFVAISSMRLPREVDASQPPQVHYAAPADAKPDRTSAIGFIRIVADGGW